MINRIFSLFRKKEAAPAELDRTAVEAELQSVRMQLRESEERAARLSALLEAQRAGETQAATAAAQRQMETLMRAAATPAAQLVMQAHLFFDLGRPVPTGDVLTLAKRLVAALEETGLTLEGKPGERTIYQPDRHLPLSSRDDLQPGDVVAIRIPGTSYLGSILTRAGVEKPAENL